ncbi:hypothetical protein HDV00_003202 [Rhizophlyctis rosea]|nr:hypothetical protein HDV00_003202 [Rhizophlyctis rosea]
MTATEPFQVFVKGFEGRTVTINDVAPDMRVQELKQKVATKTNIEADHIRLLFAAKELDSNKNLTLKEYDIRKNSTLHMVSRLPGGTTTTTEKKHSACSELQLTTDRDMITLDDDPDDLRAKMPCGHAIGPASMTAYCRSLIDAGKFRFTCPYVPTDGNRQCGATWSYSEVRKFGLLTEDEQKYFETKMSENYSWLALGVQECPRCSTYVERLQKLISSVICTPCTNRQNGTEFAFCWYCLGEVKRFKLYRCYNPHCGGVEPRLAMLRDCPTKVRLRMLHPLDIVKHALKSFIRRS